jgi:hypothetical protein
MAKAVFQRNQRVWVDSVGAWATIERIEPVWAKGFEEPVRVTYDVGLGRPFLAHELVAEDPVGSESVKTESGWRLMRARNKWQSPQDCAHHPYPGTYPVVITDAADWGGWRVPGAEYDRDPRRVEVQARMIAMTPSLRQLAQDLLRVVGDDPDEAPLSLRELARRAETIERRLNETPPTPDAGTIIEAAE